MSLQVQFLTIGLMTASGAGIGLLFDLYRVLAHELRLPRWLLPLLDLLYWAIAAVFVFWVLMTANYGEVRLFVFLGVFAGYTLYFFTLSNVSVQLIRTILHVVESIIELLIRMVEICVITPLKFFYKILSVIIGFIVSMAIFLFKVVVQLCYPVRYLIQRWLKR